MDGDWHWLHRSSLEVAPCLGAPSPELKLEFVVLAASLPENISHGISHDSSCKGCTFEIRLIPISCDCGQLEKEQ